MGKQNGEPILVCLPSSFQRYPCPQSNSVLEGSIDVPLGIWHINGKDEEINLRIEGKALTQLVQKIAESKHREMRFAYAFNVFVVAGKFIME